MPCKVVLVSCVIKLAIDVSLLVGWEFGAAEAAAATVISQYVACVLLMYWNYRDPSKVCSCLLPGTPPLLPLTIFKP